MDPTKPHIAYVVVTDLYGEINPSTSFSENSDLGNVIALGLTRGGVAHISRNCRWFGERERTIKGKKKNLQRKKDT